MKKITPNQVWIALAALAAGVLWINVFGLLHHGVLAYIGGIPAGISIVGLVVYAANALPRVQSKRAREAGWAVLILLAVVEPVVLGFANYPVIMNTTITQTGAVVVSGGASLTISLALILGALVDRSLVPAEKPAPATAQPVERPATSRSAKKKAAQRSLSEISCRYAGAGCGKTFASQNAANAHARSCGFKPTVAMPAVTKRIDVTSEMKK